MIISRRQLLVGGSAAITALAVRWPAWGASAPVESRVLAATASPLDEILGESRAIVAFRDSIRTLFDCVAGRQRRPPVLLLGESGAGKELAANVIHRAGPQSSGRFVTVGVPALPESVLEAELYGYALGAFTTPPEMPGAWERAHRGTLLLDEVAVLHAESWPKIARVIETGRVRRLGTTRSEPADVWAIAASSLPLEASVGDHRTLRDVVEPLEPVVLTVPPLRDREDDVQLLADHFLARHCRARGVSAKTLSQDARIRLGQYRWPGNVRELSNVMERAALLTSAERVELDDSTHWILDLIARTWAMKGRVPIFAD